MFANEYKIVWYIPFLDPVLIYLPRFLRNIVIVLSLYLFVYNKTTQGKNINFQYFADPAFMWDKQMEHSSCERTTQIVHLHWVSVLNRWICMYDWIVSTDDPYIHILYSGLSRYDGLKTQQPSKSQDRRPLSWTVPHRAQILCLNFIKYYSSWLHVSSQLPLLDDYFIIHNT
jgi:hypothetical protein